LSQQGFHRISVQQAASLMSSGAVVVDVRDPLSYQQGHMPGALHLGNSNLAEFVSQADQDAPTIVVCYHGHASQGAAAYLHSMDFTRVYSMDGGYSQWQLLQPQLDEQARNDR